MINDTIKPNCNYNVLNNRSPQSIYSCTCDEKCLEKDLVLCNIDKSTRLKCKYCRYRKCLDLTGMNPRWVLQQYIPKVKKGKNRNISSLNVTRGSGGGVSNSNRKYRNHLFNCFHHSANQRSVSNYDIFYFVYQYTNGLHTPNADTIVSLQTNNIISISAEDISSIVKMMKINHNKYYRSVPFGENLVKGLMFASLNGSPLRAEKQIALFRTAFEKIVRASKHFPDFMSLPLTLQQTLLKHNGGMVVSLHAAIFGGRADSMQCSNDLKNFNWLSPCAIDILKSLVSSILASHDDNCITPLLPDITHLAYFNDIDVKQRHQLLEARVKTKIKFEENLLIILSYVLLFCSDFTDECMNLEERRIIEKCQEKLVVLLQRYMYSNISQAIFSVRFTDVMETLVDLRELSDIINKIGF